MAKLYFKNNFFCLKTSRDLQIKITKCNKRQSCSFSIVHLSSPFIQVLLSNNLWWHHFCTVLRSPLNQLLCGRLTFFEIHCLDNRSKFVYTSFFLLFLRHTSSWFPDKTHCCFLNGDKFSVTKYGLEEGCFEVKVFIRNC
jgi:hypothetical protein